MPLKVPGFFTYTLILPLLPLKTGQPIGKNGEEQTGEEPSPIGAQDHLPAPRGCCLSLTPTLQQEGQHYADWTRVCKKGAPAPAREGPTGEQEPSGLLGTD